MQLICSHIQSIMRYLSAKARTQCNGSAPAVLKEAWTEAVLTSFSYQGRADSSRASQKHVAGY